MIGLSRRAVLKGIGTTLALPLFEAMRPSLAQAGPAKPPLRMAFFSVPNGVHMPDWMPKADGSEFELPYILEPLEPVKDDLLVLTGLTHDKGRANGDGPGDHARSAASFLTGAQPVKTAGSNIRVGVSVDQVAAERVGRYTKLPSLELGIEPGRGAGSCDSGYACVYSNTISWKSASTPMAKEINPRAVFDRLFSNSRAASTDPTVARRDFYRSSILDFVSDDAQRLRARLGQTDQRKLDEYLSGIREVEKSIGRAERQPAGDQPDYPVPAGIPQDYAEHIRIMGDLLVLAFQTDTTRIATCMLANEGSNRPYRFIDVPDGHHDLSHHGGDPAKHAKIRKINRFHMSQFARLAVRLKAVPEGDGTLLDHCMLVYGSGIGDGNRHNHDDLPVVLVGRGGGTLRTGRHVRYESETPMCNLFLSLLDRMGATVDELGDSTGRLPKLS
jgi:hypothetical protein